jgi:hypothetical protein
MSLRNISGNQLGHRRPNIHSLLFADDLIICGRATLQEATTIKSILDQLCQASGQVPNLSKSVILFSKQVSQHMISLITSIFPVQPLNPNTIHLGHPLLFSRKTEIELMISLLTSSGPSLLLSRLTNSNMLVVLKKLNHAGCS